MSDKNVQTGQKTDKKGIFLEALRCNLGNVTRACISAKVGRSTYYEWKVKDSEFGENVDEVREALIDLTEDKLLEKIQEGNLTAIIFYLKTQGKSRGYVERQELVGNDFFKEAVEVTNCLNNYFTDHKVEIPKNERELQGYKNLLNIYDSCMEPINDELPEVSKG